MFLQVRSSTIHRPDAPASPIVRQSNSAGPSVRLSDAAGLSFDSAFPTFPPHQSSACLPPAGLPFHYPPPRRSRFSHCPLLRPRGSALPLLPLVYMSDFPPTCGHPRPISGSSPIPLGRHSVNSTDRPFCNTICHMSTVAMGFYLSLHPFPFIGFLNIIE